jgi:alkaline phosphatase D
MFLAVGVLVSCGVHAQPYQATGFKVGEVTDTTAIVWTRLTRNAGPNSPDAPMAEFEYGATDKDVQDKRKKVTGVKYPEGMSVDDIRDAAPGAKGSVRVLYKGVDKTEWQSTPWRPVHPAQDFTRQFPLTGLSPDSHYGVRVEARSGRRGEAENSLDGGFRTAPTPDDPAKVVFTVVTGQSFPDQDCPEGYRSYPSMLKLKPNFFVHTGDIVYYDKLAKSAGLARWHWQRMYSRPTNVEFHNNVSSYFIKDDHDTWQNDCWPGWDKDTMGTFTFDEGVAIFTEQVPMGERTWRTRRWGKDLQIWMVEGRDYRSPNDMPDGPDKTIWGEEQMEWFKESVKASDASFRILISPTPVVGPDRENKHDNHSNKEFTYEGDNLREFIAGQKNMVVVCGDRHWQYVSVHPETGVREYSSGPISDEHAGGWKNEYRHEGHRYLNVVGGFMSATVERADGTPTLTFRHHTPDGDVLNTDKLTVKDGAIVEK